MDICLTKLLRILYSENNVENFDYISFEDISHYVLSPSVNFVINLELNIYQISKYVSIISIEFFFFVVVINEFINSLSMMLFIF